MAAIVHLTDLWVHDAYDTADHIRVQALTGKNGNRSRPVDVRERAGGRLRRVGRPTRRRTLQVSFRLFDQATFDWLEDHLGETVLVRTPSIGDRPGEKIYGIYRDLPDAIVAGVGASDVTLELEQVTFSEGVE